MPRWFLGIFFLVACVKILHVHSNCIPIIYSTGFLRAIVNTTQYSQKEPVPPLYFSTNCIEKRNRECEIISNPSLL